LPAGYRVLHGCRRTLTTTDTHRLWPDAYGAEFVARRDDYLTSRDVEVVVLATDPRTPVAAAKRSLRAAFGVDERRNGGPRPDSPAEALCDIGHLAGEDVLADLYGRFDGDRAADRLDAYRCLVAGRRADTHGGPAGRP